MDFFKHMTDASENTKIKVLQKQFGHHAGHSMHFKLIELCVRTIKKKRDESLTEDHCSFTFSPTVLRHNLNTSRTVLGQFLDKCRTIGLLDFEIRSTKGEELFILFYPKLLKYMAKEQTRARKDRPVAGNSRPMECLDRDTDRQWRRPDIDTDTDSPLASARGVRKITKTEIAVSQQPAEIEDALADAHGSPATPTNLPEDFCQPFDDDWIIPDATVFGEPVMNEFVDPDGNTYRYEPEQHLHNEAPQAESLAPMQKYPTETTQKPPTSTDSPKVTPDIAQDTPKIPPQLTATAILTVSEGVSLPPSPKKPQEADLNAKPTKTIKDDATGWAVVIHAYMKNEWKLSGKDVASFPNLSDADIKNLRSMLKQKKENYGTFRLAACKFFSAIDELFIRHMNGKKDYDFPTIAKIYNQTRFAELTESNPDEGDDSHEKKCPAEPEKAYRIMQELIQKGKPDPESFIIKPPKKMTREEFNTAANELVRKREEAKIPPGF
jgi:hypothetical protein